MLSDVIMPSAAVAPCFSLSAAPCFLRQQRLLSTAVFFSEDNRDNSDNGKNGRNGLCHEVTYNRDNEITVVSLFFLVKLVSYSQIVNFTKSTGSFLALGK